MHRSIWNDNDQSSHRRFKAIYITMLEEHVKRYCNVVLRQVKHISTKKQ